MMAFFIHYCVKQLKQKSLAILLMMVIAGAAHAADIVARGEPVLQEAEGNYVLQADFAINFSAQLAEAVNRGVPLYFSIDFELSQSRWYWFDRKIIQRNKPIRLSYHALTRQYRLSTGGLHHSYPSLDEAIHMLSRVRNWRVINKRDVRPGESYQAALRIRFDLTQLPKTFQVSALLNREWNLTSEWARWVFVPTDRIRPADRPPSQEEEIPYQQPSDQEDEIPLPQPPLQGEGAQQQPSDSSLPLPSEAEPGEGAPTPMVDESQ